jgi:FO synthase
MPDADLQELAATIAVARLVLGPKARIQAPPNLIGDEYALMVRAGIDDWGGVSPLTPDHVNPERPWPQIDDLAARTATAGFELRERLTIYPEYVLAGEPWLDPRVRAHVEALADPETGLAREGAIPEGRPWQEPDGGFQTTSGRSDLHTAVDTEGRSADRRDDFDSVYGDWEALRDRLPGAPPIGGNGTRGGALDAAVRAALRQAERDPAHLTDEQALTLLDLAGDPTGASADDAGLDELCRIADGLRREAVGDDVTYVVNRNINFTNVCYTGCRFCAFAQRRTDADAYTLSLSEVADRAQEAWEAGATEVCMQGGIHPDLGDQHRPPRRHPHDLHHDVRPRGHA